AVKSTSNITIESAWSYDRQFNGRTLRAIIEEGRIHLIPGDLLHRQVSVYLNVKIPLKKLCRSFFRWLWPKIVQIGLDEFVDYFNNKKTRRQRNRILPSGVAPNVVFDMPANYGLENLAIPVTQAALDELRGLIDIPRKEAFRWVSDEFEAVATEVYIGIGSPKLEALSGWTIFNEMAPVLREVVDLAQL
ncbi:hypothetical protein C8F04DRAFT_966448, partial [Mycena alexandri]